jgi:hypothetical protein
MDQENTGLARPGSRGRGQVSDYSIREFGLDSLTDSLLTF